MDVGDIAGSSESGSVGDHGPVDALSAPFLERRAAPEAAEVDAVLEHQPGGADDFGACLGDEDDDVFGGVLDPGGQVVGEPTPVLAPDSALHGGNALEVCSGEDVKADRVGEPTGYRRISGPIVPPVLRTYFNCLKSKGIHVHPRMRKRNLGGTME
jgi:hypothetical protein